ncbi:MAG: hypothetical protein WA160_15515 [Pseudobdellovibrio sp.]
MRFFLQIICCLFAFHAFAQDQNSVTNSTISNFEEYQPKSFGITLFSLGGYSDKQFKQADPSFDFFDNYISFNYKINRNFKISARPAFGYSTSGVNIYDEHVENKIRTRDFSFVAKFSNLLVDVLPASLNLANQFRLYLPTSDPSKDSGMIARLRYEVEGKYRFGHETSFRYYAKPSYYFQRSTVFFDNSNPNRPNSIKTTSKVDIEHGGEYSWELNRVFSINPGFEVQEKWSNKSEAEAKDEYHACSIRAGIGFEIAPNRDFNFTVGIASMKDLIQTYKIDETSYTLMTNVNLF